MKHLRAKIKNKIIRGAKKYGKLLGVEDIHIFPWTLKKTTKWIFVKSFWYVKFFAVMHQSKVQIKKLQSLMLEQKVFECQTSFVTFAALKRRLRVTGRVHYDNFLVKIVPVQNVPDSANFNQVKLTYGK